MIALTRTIARILGPALVALAVTERMNLHIFATQTPTVVYLNGTLLLLGGVAILQAHWRWRGALQASVTLAGCLLLASGLFRMVFPQAPQLTQGGPADAVLFALGVFGLAKTAAGYRKRG